MAPMNPEITSVITIFLNPGAFLQEAIESVLAQVDERWELLLVNDGSSDESPATARGYAATYPERIRYLEHANAACRGMSASRNLGLRHATGEFVAFLDADDAWFPNKLREQRRLLDHHPEAGMLFGIYQFWHSWDPQAASPDTFSELATAPETLVIAPRLALICYPLGTAAAPSMSDLIVRRSAIDPVGGFEERFKGMYEDQAFLMKMYLSSSVFLSGTCWSRYRQHKDSCCHVTIQGGGYDKVRYDFLQWLETYLLTVNADPAVRSALAKRLWPYRHARLHRAATTLKRVLRSVLQK